jgi:hypothetical protein
MDRPDENAEEDEPMDFAHVPFDDDDEEEEDEQRQLHGASNNLNDDSLLQLSTASGGAHDVSGLASPGLDDSQEGATVSLKRTSASPSKPKRRKRRKVIVDNDHTELSNEHIKAMLADTSDIVKRMRHPGDVEDEQCEESTTSVPILTQPFLADDGHLHPELFQLWQNNFFRALDRSCPFEKRETTEDVEQAREGATDDEEASKVSDMDQGPIPKRQEEEQEEEPDDFAPPPPMDDDEEEEDPINPPMDSDSEQDENVLDGTIGDLGLVNELQLEEDDDDEEREAVGEQVGTKWHKHTVTVLKLVQSRIRAKEEDENVDRTIPLSLEFGDLAKNVNRRTAASCFIECLVRCESLVLQFVSLSDSHLA